MTLEDFNTCYHALTAQRKFLGTFTNVEVELYSMFMISDAVKQIAANFLNLKKDGKPMSVKDLIVAGMMIGWQLKDASASPDDETRKEKICPRCGMPKNYENGVCPNCLSDGRMN